MALAEVALWIEWGPVNQRVTWVAGPVSSRGRARSNHTDVSLSFSFPSPFSKN